MAIVKLALLILGVLATLIGLLWVGQGTGIVRWPATSFMIDQSPWIYYGLLLAAIGVAVSYGSRRI
jgi:hypothetical protein